MISKNYRSLIFLLCSLPFALQGQALDNILEFFTVYPNKKAVAKDSTIYPMKAIFTPVITYAPETNLSFGIGMKGLFKIRGSGDETRTSNIPLSVQYTLENNYFFFSGFDVFFPKEKYRISGNVRVQSFPSLYYGVGPDTPKSNKEAFTYNQIQIEPIFLKRAWFPNLFIGLGPRINHISKVKPLPAGLLDETQWTGSKGSTSVGAQLAIIFDSRDNVLNANEGMYLAFTHGFYEKWLGGNQSFQLTRFDFRYYLQPLKSDRSILAFQFTSLFNKGDTPLLELGRLGGHEIMRGFFGGRYTDRHLMATQVEWRQKLNDRWGLVAFTSLGEVAPSLDGFSLKNLRFSYGAGVRFLVDREENLNLRVDVGAGQGESKLYIKIAEAF